LFSDTFSVFSLRRLPLFVMSELYHFSAFTTPFSPVSHNESEMRKNPQTGRDGL